MRAIGAAERALELMCARADARETFGKPVSTRSNIRDWIAEARIELEMLRLLVLKTAWLVDAASAARNARIEVAAIKVAAPNIALQIIDRAIQVHGGAGVSDDTPLADMYAHMRTLRLADGPDEVHKLSDRAAGAAPSARRRKNRCCERRSRRPRRGRLRRRRGRRVGCAERPATPRSPTGCRRCGGSPAARRT